MLKTTKHDAMRRLKIVQGQVKKILEMVEDERYCPDVLMQSLAVQRALKKVDAKLLEGHLRTCVKQQMSKGNVNKAVDEVLAMLQFSKHR